MERDRIMKGTYLLRMAALILVAGALRAVSQEARWVTTNRWQGGGSRQTEKFWVNGSRWRVRYQPSGKGFFQIAVYDETNSLIDVATTQKRSVPLGGHATLQGRGARHLAITGVDVFWTVSVEQYVSVIEEWHLTQLLKQPGPRLLKVGVWTGDQGTTEYTFTVRSESWQIRHSHTGDGLFQIVVENEEGFVALAANEIGAAEGQSWVHKPGTFTMRVSAEDVAWKVEVLSEERPGGG